MPLVHALPTGSVSFTPALQGATDNPVPTYTTQVGRYIVIGKLCFFVIRIVTSTMTKTTTSDSVRISLPFTAVNNSNEIARVQARVTNGTPVVNGNVGYINPNTSYLTVAQLPLTAAQADITYASGSIGVLTNTIIFEVTGMYEIA